MARTFNGTTDIIDCGTTGDTLFTENGAITISAWINPVGVGENSFGRIVDRGATIMGPGFCLADTNAIRFAVECGTTDMILQSNNSVITYNSWQHVLLTWDGSNTAANAHIYVNGSEVTYATTQNGGAAATNNSASPLRIGNYALSASRTFNGAIAEVAIWQGTQLGANDITALSKGVSPIRVSIGPSAYWPLYGSGSPEPDYGGSAYNGTLTGTTQSGHSPVMPAWGFDMGWMGAFTAGGAPATVIRDFIQAGFMAFPR